MDAATASPHARLPALRPDLEFRPGPPEPDGSPTWTVHDPLTGVFRKFGWAESEVLLRLDRPRSIASLLREIAATTTLHLRPEDLAQFCRKLHGEHLTVASAVRESVELRQEAAARRLHPVKWLLLHYLYLRIPLLHPDRFLRATLPWVRRLASRNAFLLYGVLLLAGLFFLAQHGTSYFATFPYFFNLEGAALYALALIGVKTVHEFSHAYTAKAYGVRVPTMGIAFLVLAPVAFCDVTDAWKLPRRSQRLAISVAGVVAELVIATIALFVWGVSDDGPARSIGFVLSSVTLASTLLVNLNPAMRFDGYYILSDLWGIDNLRERAFAMTRWALRRWLLGLRLPAPEDGVTPRRLAGMICYSLYAWAYRVTLYLGIAVLVYFKFTKALGAVLFLFEVGWFLLRPVVMEVQALMRLAPHLRMNRRLFLCLGAGGALLLWLALPLPRRLASPAVIVSRRRQVIYAPEAGIIQRVHASEGMRVEPGRLLATIRCDKLREQLRELRLEATYLERLLLYRRTARTQRGRLPQLAQRLRQVRARTAALAERIGRTRVRADIAGTVVAWNRALVPGTSVSRAAVLGEIADPRALLVMAFVREDYLTGIHPGESVWFMARGNPRAFAGRVLAVHPLREQTLRHPALSSLLHGDLPAVTSTTGKTVLLKSYYRVDIKLAKTHATLLPGRTGTVCAWSAPRSHLADAARFCYRALMRESGF